MNYVFNMRLTPVEPDALPIIDLPTMDSEDEANQINNDDDDTNLKSTGVTANSHNEEMDQLVSPPPETRDVTSDTEEEDLDEPVVDGKVVKVHTAHSIL